MGGGGGLNSVLKSSFGFESQLRIAIQVNLPSIIRTRWVSEIVNKTKGPDVNAF